MPVYMFRCPVHPDMVVEEIRPVSDYAQPGPKCPECGTTTEPTIAPTSFSLKGSGWPSKMFKQGGF